MFARWLYLIALFSMVVPCSGANSMYEGFFPHTSKVLLLSNKDDPMSCEITRKIKLTDYYLYAAKNGSQIDYTTVTNRVLIVINSASECGWAQQTLREVVELYRKYKHWGLQVHN